MELPISPSADALIEQRLKSLSRMIGNTSMLATECDPSLADASFTRPRPVPGSGCSYARTVASPTRSWPESGRVER
jgi:hypothetical protein